MKCNEISILTENEIFVLKHRCFMTIKAISIKLRLSHTRILEIERKAIRKLIRKWRSIRIYPYSHYHLMKDELMIFRYLIDNGIIDWYDIDRECFYRTAKEVKYKIKKRLK